MLGSLAFGFAASRGPSVRSTFGSWAHVTRSHRKFTRLPGIAMKAPVNVPLAGSPGATPAPASLAGRNPVFAQCMLRISDPKASREFYEGKMGMKFLTQLDFEDLAFSLLFFAYTDEDVPDPAAPRAERAKWLWARPYPTMELTWNWPSETEEPEKYANGNERDAGRGFGHTGFLCDDVAATTAALAKEGYTVVRPAGPFADVGSISFVADPDSYWCELIQKGSQGSGADRGVLGKDPVFAQTMLRVQDPPKTIAFFQKLGMKYITQLDFPEYSFSLYFLAFTDVPAPPEEATRAEKAAFLWNLKDCTVELTYNWLDDGEKAEAYVNGNTKPSRGFGHLGITVDDCSAVTVALENDGYKVVRPAGPFKDVGTISFVSSPGEEYWIELIQRA